MSRSVLRAAAVLAEPRPDSSRTAVQEHALWFLAYVVKKTLQGSGARSSPGGSPPAAAVIAYLSARPQLASCVDVATHRAPSELTSEWLLLLANIVVSAGMGGADVHSTADLVNLLCRHLREYGEEGPSLVGTEDVRGVRYLPGPD